MPSVLRPTVFLDRDGTLNELVYDEGSGAMNSPLWPEQLVLKPHAPQFIKGLNDLGFLCIVVTNQPGIAKGSLSLVRLDRIHRRMREELARSGAHLDGIYYCPHHPDPGPGGNPALATACRCRKPRPGMLIEATSAHYVDLYRSYMVGDRLTDMEAGRAAGLATVLLSEVKPDETEGLRDRPDARPDHVVADLESALTLIRGARDRLIAEHRG
jgi:D-glycero-D-manno-heptose 1,7-bisphosphate phosphatase